jgi:serine/threonine protein kinase
MLLRGYYETRFDGEGRNTADEILPQLFSGKPGFFRAASRHVPPKEDLANCRHNPPYTSRFMSFLPVSLEVGTTIGGYEIVSVLGRGGMGKIFKVRNQLSDRVEAMKVLLPGVDPSPELVERFLREIRVVGGLEHPGIAARRTAVRVDNQILMIMEYVEGNSLHQMLQQGRIETARRTFHATGSGSFGVCPPARSGASRREAAEYSG